MRRLWKHKILLTVSKSYKDKTFTNLGYTIISRAKYLAINVISHFLETSQNLVFNFTII